MTFDEPTRAIVEYATGIDYSALSATGIRAVVRNLVDAVGCGAAGFSGEPTTISRRMASQVDGYPAASVFGVPDPKHIGLAVLSNATAIRYCDWNDGGLNGGHPSDATAALVALAESASATPQNLICALHATYEMISALGLSASLDGWDLGINISAGVVVGGAILLRLTREQVANALAIALVPSVPLRVARTGGLTHWKAVATAHSAMTAVLALRLAQEGMEGPQRIFDGKCGLWDQGVTKPFKLDHLGKPLAGMSAPERVAHKRYPAVMSAQGPIEMMSDLSRAYDHSKVVSILLYTTDLSWHECGGGQGDAAEKWDPQTRETADHSLPYLMARSLRDGGISVESFDHEKVHDASLRGLMNKIRVLEDPVYSARRRDHGESNSRIELELDGGSMITQDLRFPAGHAMNPLSDSQLDEKFQECASRVLAPVRAAELHDRLWNLDRENGLTEIVKLFRKFGEVS